ncbi:unnamed protein product [Brassica oleracea]
MKTYFSSRLSLSLLTNWVSSFLNRSLFVLVMLNLHGSARR